MSLKQYGKPLVRDKGEVIDLKTDLVKLNPETIKQCDDQLSRQYIARKG